MSIFRYVNSAMVYNIRQNQSKYFFLASYQLSSGVEDKILTKKYFRGGQKIRKLMFSMKNEHFNLCNGHTNIQNQPKYLCIASYQMSRRDMWKIKCWPGCLVGADFFITILK